MKNWKRIMTALLIGTTAVGMTACGSTGGTSADADTEEKTSAVTEASGETTDSSDYKVLRIGSGDATENHLIDLARIAEENGYLEEELNAVGWTYEVTGFAGQGPEINAALMSDSLDAAVYGGYPALTSTSSGADLSIVAVVDPRLTYGILVASDEIQEPADLEGKKVVVQQGTLLHYAWESFVEGTGIDGESIEIINSNASDALSLLQTGDADAFISAGYSIGYYEAQGIGHRLEGYDLKLGSTSTFFVVNNSVLEADPEVGVAINKALIRTYNDILEDQDNFYNILGERYGVDSVKAAYGFDGTLDYLTPEITEEVISLHEDLYDWMTNYQLLASDFDPTSILATEYYQQAVDELGE